MTAHIESDYEAMRSKRTQYHRAGQVFDAVDTLCAIRTAVMGDSGASFDDVTVAISDAIDGDGTTPERFARLVSDIGEEKAWILVYVTAWAAVDPRVEGELEMTKTDLFPSAPRRPRRVLMHVVDATGCDSKTVQLECRKCGMRTDWLSFNTHSEADRQPCPVCNGGKQ